MRKCRPIAPPPARAMSAEAEDGCDPPAPLRALHAGLQCPRAGEGARHPRRCADPGSRRCRRARRERDGAAAGRGRGAREGFRQARGDRARQRAVDIVGRGRRRGRRGSAPGCDPDPESLRGRRPVARRRARARRGAVGDDRDAARDPQHRRTRRRGARAGLLRHGHQRSRQGDARRAHEGPRQSGCRARACR